MQQEDTGLTVIYLSRIGNARSQRRVWEIEVTHNGEKIHPNNDMSLLDPFMTHQYSTCFKFLADDSFQPYRYNRSENQNQQMVQIAKTNMPTYGTSLLEALGLDRPTLRRLKKHDILVVEDLDTNCNDNDSLHNIVWELLEDPRYWLSTSQERVTVTRIIRPPGSPRLPAGTDWRELKELRSSSSISSILNTPDYSPITGLHEHRPLRMLLVIGRCLRHDRTTQTNFEYAERITPGIIQKTIMQTVKHLNHLGHTRKVQLEILRPGTFRDLKAYLGIDPVNPNTPKHTFDIIHLDMHGVMRRSPGTDTTLKPHLMFTWVPMETCYVLVSDVARALGQCTDLLVMNACNSSSISGQLGIRMVRTFLQEDMGCISATSYRLQESAAKIYYPHFYMSLLLNGSFNRAAADARAALRRNQTRYRGEERDDHYVHWNWSRTANLRADVEPLRSKHLLIRMLLESIPRVLCWLYACMCFKVDAWRDSQADDYPMYAIHRQFDRLDRHVLCAEQNDIPSMGLHILEAEYYLTKNDKHSVYLHSAYNDGPGRRWISSLIRNTVRIWVETNFVSEVRLLTVQGLLDRDCKPWRKPRLWMESWYAESMKHPDWIWSQENPNPDQKPPSIRRMLIIDGFENLEPQSDARKREVLNKIGAIAEQMQKEDGDFYLITIGSLVETQWKLLPSDYARKNLTTLTMKWTGIPILMVPLEEDTELATYVRKRRR
ncbi:hypothetical protein EJ04DRAFT_558416 [Polyplosphaeria fusca]|uniref:CHAT domain-containing protein n=1 Tax=Polyplosphaeria fusca TaxID=682080 RepID=A0A9P4V958_9PLEO|nr:hypothetical protein EJ04DRAFT_558416 [Polyplosphaeria fusca]